MSKEQSKGLGWGNMNGTIHKDDETCGLQDMNCVGDSDKDCSLDDMNCKGKDDDSTCGLVDMNCLGENK